MVESALFWGAAHLCSEADELWLRRTLADPGFYLFEVAVLTLAAVTGLLAAAAPWSVVLLLPVYAVMQQAVLHRPLRDQATLDPKTGLLRHDEWLRLAEEKVAHHLITQPWSLMFADLDRFKDFNDRSGHLTGDDALAAVAGVLRSAPVHGALISRFGGEEFCMLLPNTTGPQAVAIADRVRTQVAEVTAAEFGSPLTISIGVTAVDADGLATTLEDALARADLALYQAKSAGRNAVHLAPPALSTARSRDTNSSSHQPPPPPRYDRLEGVPAEPIPFVPKDVGTGRSGHDRRSSYPVDHLPDRPVR